MDELTTTEANRLDELEQVIEQGQRTFVEVGEALAEIQRLRLYKSSHKSFDVYCRERWGFSDSYARRLIGVADVAQTVPMGTEMNERQLRELKAVEPDRRVEVLERAASLAPTGKDGKPKVTAAAIREAADQPTAGDPEPDARTRRAGEALVRFDELRRLLRALRNEMKAIREEGQIPHITNGFEMQVDALSNLLKEATPHASCPHCAGKACEKCRGRGWFTKTEYNQLSKRDQSKAVEL